MGILDDAIRQHLDLKRQHGAEVDEVKRLEDEAFGLPTRPGEPDFPESQEQPAVAGKPGEAGDGPAAAEAEVRWPPPKAPLDTGKQPESEVAEPPAPEAPSEPEPEPAPPAPVPPGASTDEEEAAFFDQALEDDLDLDDLDLDLEDEEAGDLVEEAQLEPASQEVEAEPASEELSLEPDSEEQPLEPISEEQPLEPISEELPLEPISEESPAVGMETVEHPMEEELAGEPDSEEAPLPPPAEEPAGDSETEGDEDEDVLEETPEFLRDQPEDDELWFEQGEPKDFDF